MLFLICKCLWVKQVHSFEKTILCDVTYWTLFHRQILMTRLQSQSPILPKMLGCKMYMHWGLAGYWCKWIRGSSRCCWSTCSGSWQWRCWRLWCPTGCDALHCDALHCDCGKGGTMVVRLPEPEYMPVMLEWNDLHVMQNGLSTRAG